MAYKSKLKTSRDPINVGSRDVSSNHAGALFKSVYRILATNVELIGKGRQKMPWLDKQNYIAPQKIAQAVNLAANALPYDYQGAYVVPLRSNLPLLIEQLSKQTNRDWILENLVGAVFDHVDPMVYGRDFDTENVLRSLQWQIKQFLAVISNFYRTFLSAEVRSRLSLDVNARLPSLATFKYEADFANPVPYIIPAAETKLLFGASVGVVVLPSTYRNHPILWASLAHEVGGHDVLRADEGLLAELESKVYRLFADGNVDRHYVPGLEFLKQLNEGEWRKVGPQKTPERQFLGYLWRYWISEAAADIYGVLNMGPAFALNAALYTALFNKEINRVKQAQLKEQGGEQPKAALGMLSHEAEEMKATPVLKISRRINNDEMGDLETHPPDCLRLYTMVGAIEYLDGLDLGTKNEYVRKLNEVISICTTNQDNKPRESQVKLQGYVQTGSDTWILVADEKDEKLPLNLPLDAMKIFAREVGRFVVSVQLEKFENHTIQDLVRWDDRHETVAMAIKKRLLEDEASPHSIVNWGDDAQLLAGTSLALFEQSMGSSNEEKMNFYNKVNDRLAEALWNSFQRDEVWGDTALACQWALLQRPRIAGRN